MAEHKFDTFSLDPSQDLSHSYWCQRVFIIGDCTVGLLNEPLDVTENFLKARIDLKLCGLEAPFQTLS